MTSSPRIFTPEEIEFLQKRQTGETYEQHLMRIARHATRITLTDEENLQIMKDLNEGMEDFILQEKKMRAETAQEFKTLHIGGYNPI